MSLGSSLIWVASAAWVVAFITAVRWARGNENAERTCVRAYHVMSATLFAASAVLMIAIFKHDFRFDYVIGYSSRDLPVLYLISAFWAGQEGTYLLWGLMGALLGYFLIRKGAWERAAVTAAYLPTVGFMLLLMLNSDGNPFRLAPRVPADGRGLNPLLQDPWMATHPPAVFIGYVALAVPAALALVALLRRKEDEWTGPALPWGLAGFFTLGVGIVLGGFWAYKVLGWGGYWGWDPVENASLVPWIASAALLHGLLVQRSTGALRRTNLALALGGYVLVMYATFLTRSGVLADFSVHSFPKGSIYQFLVGILAVIIGVSIYGFYRGRSAEKAPGVSMQLGWPLILTATVILLCVSGLMVVVATSWPIVTSALGNPAIIPVEFYNRANLPLYIVLLSLLGVAPFLSWARHRAPHWWRQPLVPAVLALAACLLAVRQGMPADRYLVLFGVAAFAILSNGLRLAQVARGNILQTGAAIAHIGFALLFVGIVGSGVWGQQEEVYLPLDQPREGLGGFLTFHGHVAGSEPLHRWSIGLRPPGGAEQLAEVGLHNIQVNGESQLMRKPAIVRGLTQDLYLAPAGIENAGGGAGHQVTLAKDEPVELHDAVLTFQGFGRGDSGDDDHSMEVIARVHVVIGDQHEEMLLPLTATAEGLEGRPVASKIWSGAELELERMNVESGQIAVAVRDHGSGVQTLVLQASTKPLIGMVWLGTILLGVGCVVATVRRALELRAGVESPANAARLVRPSKKAVA